MTNKEMKKEKQSKEAKEESRKKKNDKNKEREKIKWTKASSFPVNTFRFCLFFPFKLLVFKCALPSVSSGNEGQMRKD